MLLTADLQEANIKNRAVFLLLCFVHTVLVCLLCVEKVNDRTGSKEILPRYNASHAARRKVMSK